MIRHIVMWKKLDETTDKDLDELLKLSETLKTIPGVKSLEFIVGSKDTSTHDIMLNVVFDNMDLLNNYQVHPTHKNFGAHLKPLVKERVCIDYEF